MRNSYQLHHIALASLVLLKYQKSSASQQTHQSYIRFSRKPQKTDQPTMQWRDL